MRVDRTTFLFVAGAMYACHAEHQRRAGEAESLPDVPPPVATASSELDASNQDAADAVSNGIDAGVIDAVADAVSDAPAPPLPTLAALSRRCRSLPADRNDCAADSRRQMCQTVLLEFDRAFASRAVDCYEQLESVCDVCGVRTCTLNALWGSPKKQLAECESVRKAADQSSEGYGQIMYDLCQQYASGMTRRGRQRFSRCLERNMGVGVRFCLWDPSTTPCTESEPRDPAPSF